MPRRHKALLVSHWRMRLSAYIGKRGSAQSQYINVTQLTLECPQAHSKHWRKASVPLWRSEACQQGWMRVILALAFLKLDATCLPIWHFDCQLEILARLRNCMQLSAISCLRTHALGQHEDMPAVQHHHTPCLSSVDAKCMHWHSSLDMHTYGNLQLQIGGVNSTCTTKHQPLTMCTNQQQLCLNDSRSISNI